MNYIKFSFTLFMVVIVAFVMIYIVEGYYESRLTPTSATAGLPQNAVPAQENSPASLFGKFKGFFRQAAEPSGEAPLDLSQKTEERTEIHHGLCVAAMTGDYEKTKMLLDSGVSANTRDAFGIRAITRATLWGHHDVVKLLLDRGANVNEKERLGVTLLMLAANQGDEKLLRLFLEKGADVNAKSEDGETAMTTAARKGHGALVALLKKSGAEVPEDFHLPQAPAPVEVKGDNRSIANRLFSRGKDAASESAASPASDLPPEPVPAAPVQEISGVPEASELLNLPGEQPRALSSDALAWAANVSQASIQEKELPLLPEDEETEMPRLDLSDVQQTQRSQSGSIRKVTASEPVFKAPVRPAEKIQSAGALKLSESKPSAELPPVALPVQVKVKKVDLSTVPTEEEMLEEALLNLNRRRSEETAVKQLSPQAFPAVPAAVEKNPVSPSLEPAADVVLPVPVVSKEDAGFFSKPMEPAERAFKPVPPPAKPAVRSRSAVSQDLLHATLMGDAAKVRQLLEAGADVNVRGALDMTPLMIAAQDGHLLVVKALLQKGADIHAQNIVGQTALRLAMLRERQAVIAVLRHEGAAE